MRATSKVTIQNGLMVVPYCKTYKAIDEDKVSFNQLHALKEVIDKEGNRKQIPCLSRINQVLHCPACNKDIVDKKVEIVKGYPNPLKNDKTSFVVLTTEEIEGCKKEASDIIRVFQYVDPAELCEIYFDDASYIAVEPDGLEPYTLFYYMLEETGKIALAKMIARGKDNFLAIKTYEEDGKKVLVAFDLHFPNQIRSIKEISVEINPEKFFDQETLDLALGLVKKMTKPFDKSAIKDDYNDALRNIIKAKARGEAVNIVEEKVERKVVSLKDALKGSLAA